jgi:hypothetical protein
MKYSIIVLGLLSFLLHCFTVAVDFSQLKGSAGKGRYFALSHDKQQIVTHASDETCVYNRLDMGCVWKSRYWKKWLQKVLHLNADTNRQGVACSCQEDLVATVHDSRMIIVSKHENDGLKPIHTFCLQDATSKVTSVSFVGKGTSLAVGCDNGTVYTLYVSKDGAYRKNKRIVSEDDVSISALSADAAGTMLVAVCKKAGKSEVKVFPIHKRNFEMRTKRSLDATPSVIKQFGPEESDIISVACSPGGDSFVIVHEGGKMQLCKIDSNTQMPVAKWKTEGVCSVQYDDEEHLLVGYVDRYGPRIETVDLSENFGGGKLSHDE